LTDHEERMTGQPAHETLSDHAGRAEHGDRDLGNAERLGEGIRRSHLLVSSE
jgi:hypothetical protein